MVFTDLSTGTPTGWSWSFGDGDGTNASVQNPVHTYQSIGNYTVSLTAMTIGGNNTMTKVNYITVTSSVVAPVANFNAIPRNGTAPLTVNFTDLTTNGPTKWNWTFGDGSTTNSTVMNPVHTYANMGNYTVSLNATNSAGSNTLTRVGYINVSQAPPAANFSATPRNGTLPLTVKFTDLSTNTPVSWNWTFGDGNTANSTLKNPVDVYLTPGNFTVSLNATNSGGSNISVKTGYINVTLVLKLLPVMVGAPLEA